jgi:formyltetrahydrofolate-dependent phosphoribosylglycinamide formyltransferase
VTGEGADASPARVVVLVSGSGTNLQSLLDRFNLGGDDDARVVRVIGSSPGIGALDRARAAGVETAVLEDHDEDGGRLQAHLEAADADLVVLAGYLRLVPAPVVRPWRGRMVNVHPALLPSFGGQGMYGRRVHEAVIEAGARVSGPTVHFVDEEYDRGPIIAQWPVPVLEGDGPDELAARVLRHEHRLLPRVVSGLARGTIRLDDEGRTRWERPLFPGDRFELAGP